jgi:hypothetical protein
LVILIVVDRVYYLLTNFTNRLSLTFDAIPRMQEAVAGAQRRSRARTCAAVLELWNALLDRKVRRERDRERDRERERDRQTERELY